MGVRFTGEVRRLIVLATTLAEARGHSRPSVRELADAMKASGLDVPPFPPEAEPDDLEEVLGEAARFAGTDELNIDLLLRAFGEQHNPALRDATAAVLAAASPPAPTVARVGIGYDSHPFATGGPMVLGGIRIESGVHCAGHSDGDAICHALTDAVLGAANAGDIGELFPDSDPANAGKDSVVMLRAAVECVRARGFRVLNADVTVIAEQPKIGPHRDAMRAALAPALGVDGAVISIKGKTNEGMGWIGRGEGLAVIAVASLAGGVR